ncbi:ATPase, AAA family [Treponema primitia ZAS-2]|uniref:ATPase, AAA family n=1 Tax=Treponema primitia (strain ATCC BAA-887 / DSM 12427 / ZAS-2) TaxID=545694 RepID=F5YIT4_TREPZ|nr:AAA family ATPase [Treponema primitia]AEF83599.1 ATPase, AAA family [Treponema primitia ZAS-2]
MNAISPTRAAYWKKQVETRIMQGKAIPERLGKALCRMTYISLDATAGGNSQYVPDRSPPAVDALTAIYQPFPEVLSVILSVTEPIAIGSVPVKRPKAATPAVPLIKFREPKYAQPVAKLIEAGHPILLVGPAGCGKTRLFYDIAQKARKNIYRVNFDGGMTPDAFIGGVRLRSVKNPDGTATQETYFLEGPVVKAAKEGAWLLLDEIDKAQPEYAAALHAMIEDIHNPIVLNDDGGKTIKPHKDFRILATANTLGNMEDISLGYYGSSPMSAAFKDRFAILQVDYPPDEPAIINDILHDKDMSTRLVKVAKLVRQAMMDGRLTGSPFSTRRLIALAFAFKCLGDLEMTIELELLGRFSSAGRSLVESFISNVFTNKWRKVKDTAADTASTT